jgi:hypothetical protein
MPRAAEVISHWHYSLEDFGTSGLDFYRAVDETLRAKQAPIDISRVEWKESGVLSARREYLRVSHGRFSFDLCAAPFGKDFIFSWWLVRRGFDNALLFGCLGILAIPVLLVLCISIAGFVAGVVLFVAVLGVGGVAVVNANPALIETVEDAIGAIPVIGTLYARFLRPVTYYSEDSRLIFEEAVHRVVLRHVETLTTVSKLPPLTEDQKKPQTRRTLR